MYIDFFMELHCADLVELTLFDMAWLPTGARCSGWSLRAVGRIQWILLGLQLADL